MIAKSDKIHSLWDMAVIAMLHEGPNHPYEMQRLLRERHKDELLVLKRGSLYHSINRLLRSRLIEAVETGRSGRRPERTTYQVTAAGEQALTAWLRQMVSVPQHESSEFIAALSFLVYLDPQEAVSLLELRAESLANAIQGLGIAIDTLVKRVRRINLIENEYLIAMRKAELEWVRALIVELKTGRFTWDLQEIIEAIRTAKRASSETP